MRIIRPLTVAALCAASAYGLDLKHAVIVAPAGLVGPEKKIAPMLVEEIEKRTRIRLAVSERAPASGPAIVHRRPSDDRGGRRAPMDIACRSRTGRCCWRATIRAARCSRRARCCAICRWTATRSRCADDLDSPPRRSTRCAATSSATGRRPTPTTRWNVADVGAVHPRPGGLRHQRHRADSAALGRRRRQPALSAAADADDDRDVAHRRRVRPGRLDLVSGDGPGLLRPEDGRVRAARNGARCSGSCRASTRCSCPAAIPATPSRNT